MANEDKKLKEGNGLDYKLGNIKIDGIKVVVTSGLLALLGISHDCSHMVGMANVPGFQNALVPFDIGAGDKNVRYD